LIDGLGRRIVTMLELKPKNRENKSRALFAPLNI